MITVQVFLFNNFSKIHKFQQIKVKLQHLKQFDKIESCIKIGIGSKWNFHIIFHIKTNTQQRMMDFQYQIDVKIIIKEKK